MSVPPRKDDLVGVEELGLEIRVRWRDKWRHEIHRWPIWYDESMSEPQWKMEDEVPGPLECESDISN